MNMIASCFGNGPTRITPISDSVCFRKFGSRWNENIYSYYALNTQRSPFSTHFLSLYRCCFGGHWQQLYCYWVLDTFKKKHVLPVLLIADCQCVSATIVLSMLRLLLLVTCVCTYETVICCVYGKPYQTINTMGTDLCHDDNVVASETHKQKTRLVGRMVNRKIGLIYMFDDFLNDFSMVSLYCRT